MAALTCDICGGNLAMNESGDFAVCESCGMKHTKERVKIKVQEIKGVVEVTKGDAEKTRLLENAKQLFDIKEYKKSLDIYQQITEDFPTDYFAWTQMAYVNLLWKLDDGYGVDSDDLARCLSFVETAKKLNNGFEENLFWKSIVNKHGNDLLIREERYTDVTYNCTYTVLNAFDAELICFDTDKLHPVLQDLQIRISQQYVNKFLSGELLLFCKRNDEFSSVHTEFWGQDCHYHCFMRNELPYKNAIMQKLYDEGMKKAKHANALNGNSYERVLFSLATARVVCNGDYSRVQVVKIPSDNVKNIEITQAINAKCSEAIKPQDEQTIWKKNGRCVYCGGEFKGIFKKVCSKCGQPKEY